MLSYLHRIFPNIYNFKDKKLDFVKPFWVGFKRIWIRTTILYAQLPSYRCTKTFHNLSRLLSMLQVKVVEHDLYKCNSFQNRNLSHTDPQRHQSSEVVTYSVTAGGGTPLDIAKPFRCSMTNAPATYNFVTRLLWHLHDDRRDEGLVLDGCGTLRKPPRWDRLSRRYEGVAALLWMQVW